MGFFIQVKKCGKEVKLLDKLEFTHKCLLSSWFGIILQLCINYTNQIMLWLILIIFFSFKIYDYLYALNSTCFDDDNFWAWYNQL